jgi:hypothetical protein
MNNNTAYEVKFDFTDFAPEQDLKHFVGAIAEKIHLSAPSDSFMKMIIQKGTGAVRASCHIASEAGTFVAHSVCDSPFRAVTQLERKINSQLKSWKRRRFKEL